MIAEILSLANLSPTFVIGGVLNSAGSGAVLGSGSILSWKQTKVINLFETQTIVFGNYQYR